MLDIYWQIASIKDLPASSVGPPQLVADTSMALEMDEDHSWVLITGSWES